MVLMIWIIKFLRKIWKNCILNLKIIGKTIGRQNKISCWKNLSKFKNQNGKKSLNTFKIGHRICVIADTEEYQCAQRTVYVVSLVNKFGQKWKLISSKMTRFTPKQIRQRYLNYLRPTIIKEDFTVEEDLKICKYVLENGKHWRRMEEILPGRAQGCIKGRYYGKLQKIIQRCLNKSLV